MSDGLVQTLSTDGIKPRYHYVRLNSVRIDGLVQGGFGSSSSIDGKFDIVTSEGGYTYPESTDSKCSGGE